MSHPERKRRISCQTPEALDQRSLTAQGASLRQDDDQTQDDDQAQYWTTGQLSRSWVPSVGEELDSSRLERTGGSGGDELLPDGGDTIIPSHDDQRGSLDLISLTLIPVGRARSPPSLYSRVFGRAQGPPLPGLMARRVEVDARTVRRPRRRSSPCGRSSA